MKAASELHSIRQIDYLGVCVAKNLPEQTGAERLTGVHRDRRYATVPVALDNDCL